MPEIAKICNKLVGEDIISPSRFSDIRTKNDLRERSGGRPIGIKIAAGHIEKDLECIACAKPDFITIDGRGGATGASPLILREASSVPTIYALYRVKKYLVDYNLDIDLVIKEVCVSAVILQKQLQAQLLCLLHVSNIVFVMQVHVL